MSKNWMFNDSKIKIPATSFAHDGNHSMISNNFPIRIVYYRSLKGIICHIPFSKCVKKKEEAFEPNVVQIMLSLEIAVVNWCKWPIVFAWSSHFPCCFTLCRTSLRHSNWWKQRCNLYVPFRRCQIDCWRWYWSVHHLFLNFYFAALSAECVCEWYWLSRNERSRKIK